MVKKTKARKYCVCKVKLLWWELGAVDDGMGMMLCILCAVCGVVQNPSRRQCKQSVRGVTTNNHRRHLLRYHAFDEVTLCFAEGIHCSSFCSHSHHSPHLYSLVKCLNFFESWVKRETEKGFCTFNFSLSFLCMQCMHVCGHDDMVTTTQRQQWHCSCSFLKTFISDSDIISFSHVVIMREDCEFSGGAILYFLK